jgi:dihydroorotase
VNLGLEDEEGANAASLEAEHQSDQRAMAAISRRGKQVIATRSGHHIQLDEPELVVETIQQLLATRP